MMIKMYSGFALVAIASGIVSLVRLQLDHDIKEAIWPNVVIGGVCLACMMILHYRERKQIERRA